MVAMIERPRTAARAYDRAWIFLGDNEWGNDFMENVAREFAQRHAQRPLVVSVYEHAGWLLEFYFDQTADGVVVGTATDEAHFSEPALSIRRALAAMECRTLPEVRR